MVIHFNQGHLIFILKNFKDSRIVSDNVNLFLVFKKIMNPEWLISAILFY